MRFHKKSLLGLLSLIVFFSLFASQINTARAGFPTFELGSVPTEIRAIWEKREVVLQKIKDVAINDLIQRNVAMYMDNLSYNLAMQLGTGAPGQETLVEVRDWKQVFKKSNEAVVGNFIGDINELGFDELGLNLCNPSIRNVQLKLTIPLYLIDSKAPPKPKCNWNQVQANWQQFDRGLQDDLLVLHLRPTAQRIGPEDIADYDNPGQVSAYKNYIDFWEGFSYSQSDFGVLMEVRGELVRREEEAEKAKQAEIENCNRFKNVETPIDKQTITTCTQIITLLDAQAQTTFKNASEKQAGNTGGGSTLDNSYMKILKDAANKFVNTYSSRLMKQWFTGGVFTAGTNQIRDAAGYLGDYFSGSDLDDADNPGTDWDAYRQGLLDFLRSGDIDGSEYDPRKRKVERSNVATEIVQVTNFDLLENFAICPDQAEFRHPDNCTISTSFLTAANSRLTVGNAIEQGILNGNLTFVGPNNRQKNFNDDCYLDALCHSNLVKLRKANIIPIGWEMAAERSPQTSPLTLQQAIDCFEDFDNGRGNCRFGTSTDYMVDGEAHNPFYHLVDPNWVLKVPAATCDALVYSPILEADDSTDRQQYCADVKTCLREDKNGNCIEDNYGYCTKSENIWGFDGDICEDGELFSGCLNFSNKEFGKASYVEGSLNYCTSDEVGCRRYSQEVDSEGNWVFDDIDSDEDDLFLSTAPECPSNEAGCNEYIIMSADTNANLIPNGDFEIWTDTSVLPDGFFDTAETTSTGGVGGSNAVLAAFISSDPPVNNLACQRNITLVPNTNYSVSVDVKINQDLPGNGPARITLDTCTDLNGDDGNVSVAFDDPNTTTTNDGGPTILPHDEVSVLVDASELSQTEYRRISGTFNSGNSVTCGQICVGANYGNTNPHLFDNLKMEIVSSPKNNTNYSSYGDGAKVYLNGNTFMCTQEEVGCMAYSPSNGDPIVPAVIDQGDLCPAECVGYATFAEEPTYFDEAETATPLVEYHNFIPRTAQSCPLQQVGCDEFTNLDEVAAGGEGTEYYTYLRQCVNEEDGEVYFTWEGSDVDGYQLKRWVALPSLQVDWNGESENAPCTNVDFDGTCTDTGGAWNATNMAVCGPVTPSILDDPEFDPNCREFIDVDGNSFFRLQDKVIFASNDCKDFRRTITGQVYRALPDLSTSCDSTNNGCRLYIGDTDNNLRQVFSDNFENGTYSPWTSSGNLDISTESLNLNGHSMRGRANGIEYRRTFSEEARVNREYEASFWMKSEAAISSMDVAIDVGYISGGSDIIPMDISSDFQNIEAGNWNYFKTSVYLDESLLLPRLPEQIESMALYIESNASVNGYVYFDNIILKEVINNTSVVKNSWLTPVSCDTPFTGYHLGCQSYTDTNGNKYNLKSFNSLCREEAVGCLPAIDTHNSSYPFERVYHESYCSDGVSVDETACTVAGEIWNLEYSEITVPEDNITYLVPNRQNYCAVNYKGCQALGLQDRDDPDSTFTDYRINDPDTYNRTLCFGDSLDCSSFESDKGTYYFKDPSFNTCTYREDVNIDGNVVKGWFSDFSKDEVSGVPFGCSDVSDPPSWYDSFGAFEFSDLNVSSTIAQTCPSDKNLCTGFKDLNSPQDCNPRLDEGDYICRNTDPNAPDECTMLVSEADCTAATPTPPNTCEWVKGVSCDVYYYYDNDDLNEGECNGLVDPTDGCMLFYDENYWNGEHDEVVTLYDANQTYYQSSYLAKGVSPIVCGDFDPLCTLNSNRLVQVNQDRQCAEWLACRSSSVVFDSNTKSYRVICDDIGSCNEYSGDNNITSCGNWASIEEEDIVPMSTEYYQNRGSGPNDHITWSDFDFTGYSVPNMLPVGELVTHEFSDDNDISDTRLVYGHYNQEGSNSNRYHIQCVDPADVNNTEPYDGTLCNSVINSEEFTGECDQGFCWILPVSGLNSTSTYNRQTRGYAAMDAPFPVDVQEDIVRDGNYSSVNICIDSDGAVDNSCEDNYAKVTYGQGGLVKYYPEQNDIMPGVCLSGRVGVLTRPDGTKFEQDCTVLTQHKCNTRDPDPNSTEEPRPDGMCQEKSKIEIVNNWPGVCLDYDYSTEFIGENGEKNYYCNLWYPVNKIQGANSLYNNYREAGYYNEDGNDVLYCAIAEPYKLVNDRIYCAAAHHGYCTVLVRVPAGSGVHIGAIQDDLGPLLNYGYLKTEESSGENVFNVIPAYDPTSTTAPNYATGTEYTNYRDLDVDEKPRTYFERLEHANLPLDRNRKTGDQFQFSITDFVVPEDIYDIADIVIPQEDIPRIFDATSTYYFWDENIKSNTGYDVSAKVQDPVFGFPATWGPECDLDAQPDNWTCDTPASAGGGHWIRNNTPGGENHAIYTRPASAHENQGANGPVYDCNGGCGINKSKVCRAVWCNPLDHGYYVKAELGPDDAPEVCTETDCGDGALDQDGILTGRECLDNADSARPLNAPTSYPISATYPTYYADTLASTTFGASPATLIGDMTDESQCDGNPNCEYIYCMENRETEYDTLDGAGELYCSEFGKIGGFDFVVQEIIEGEVEDSWNFYNVTEITECLDRLYEIEEDVSIYGDGGPDESNENLSIPLAEYDSAVEKDGVDDELIDQLFGYALLEGQTWINQFPGCLTELVYDTAGYAPGTKPARARQCTTIDDGVLDYCNWSYSRDEGFVLGPCYYYPQEIAGTACDLNNGCYYQCGVVTELDAEGDNSWVRTDVWWRSEKSPEGRMQPVASTPWAVKYFDPSTGAYSSYSLDSNYFFIEGINDRFEYFGGSIGSAKEGLVVTKANYNSNSELGHNSAYTFFYDTTTDPLPAEAWNDQSVSGLFNTDAAQNMVWLFGRAYNLQWDRSIGQYVNPEEIPGSNIPHLYELHGELGSFYPGYSIANPVMGDDYDPRILKACPRGYCEETDSDGNFLYNIEGITVNDQALPPDGSPPNSYISVIGRGGTLFTAIKFYYHAHPDHMPIRDIQVDWGDGYSSDVNFNSSPGKYKNSLVKCDEDRSLPKVSGEATTTQGFGGTDGACREGYTVLYHTYEYDDFRLCGGNAEDPPIASGEEASCYVPTVRIIDNFQQATEARFDGAVTVYKD